MMKRFLLSLLFLVGLTIYADAATCFWVGGTGNWDNTNVASWSSGTGGAGSTCAATGGIPKNNTDVATFDNLSGGGVVTVCGASSANCPSGAGSVNLGVSGQIVSGTFTGTLDFATNNPTVSIGTFNGSGAGTRTVNMGSGTFTCQAAGPAWNMGTVTGLTFNKGTSTIVINNSGTSNVITFAGGGLTYNNVSLGPNSAGNQYTITGSNTFAALSVTAPLNLLLASGTTQTIQSAFTWSGTSGNELSLMSNSQVTRATISATTGSTLTWAAIFGVTFTTSAVSATSSFDLGGNTMNGGSITAPASGVGGGRIIGG